MSTKIETRTVASELRATDDSSFQIRGTAAAYNRLSKTRRLPRRDCAPGAFKCALSGQGGDVNVCSTTTLNAFLVARTTAR